MAPDCCPVCDTSFEAQADAAGLLACPRCKVRFLPRHSTSASLVTSTTAGGPVPIARIELPPEFVARYALGRVLGCGAFGTVYHAIDSRTGQPVAIKFLMRPDRPEILARFVREGRLLSRIHHPNVIDVREVMEVAGHPCLVTEYVEGGTLGDRMAGGPRLTLPTAVSIALDVLDGLAACHERGIVHRDVKPANILLTSDGRAKVADFGIAKQYGADTQLTAVGVLLGTPLYMAPEVLRGETAIAASDVYSMAAVLYEMLSGSTPCPSPNLAQILVHHELGRIRPVADCAPAVPPRLASAVDRALSLRVDQRPSTAGDFARWIRNAQAQTSRPRRGSPTELVPVVLVAALIMMLSLWPGGAPHPVSSPSRPSLTPAPVGPRTTVPPAARFPGQLPSTASHRSSGAAPPPRAPPASVHPASPSRAPVPAPWTPPAPLLRDSAPDGSSGTFTTWRWTLHATGPTLPSCSGLAAARFESDGSVTMADASGAVTVLSADGRSSRSIRPEVMTSWGPEDPARAVSPDLACGVSYISDTGLAAWDLVHAKALRVEGLSTQPVATRFFSDSRRLAVVDRAGRVAVIDIVSGEHLPFGSQAGSGADLPTALAVAPDGSLVVTGHASGRIRLLFRDTSRPPRTISGHSQPVETIEVSPAGNTVFAASADMISRTVPRTGAVDSWPWSDPVPTALTLCPDGLRILMGDVAGNLSWWDAFAGPVRARCALLPDRVNRIVVAPDGRKALVGCASSRVVLWSLDPWRSLGPLEAHPTPRTWRSVRIERIVLSRNGRTAVTAGSDGRLAVWDVPAREAIARFRVPDAHRILQLGLSDDGGRALVRVGDRCDILDLRTGLVRASSGPLPGSWVAAITPDGSSVLVADDRAIRTFTGQTPATRTDILVAPSFPARFSPDGRFLVSVLAADRLGLIDTRTGRLVRTLDLGPGVPSISVHDILVRFSPGGERILVSGRSWFSVIDLAAARVVDRGPLTDAWLDADLSGDGATAVAIVQPGGPRGPLTAQLVSLADGRRASIPVPAADRPPEPGTAAAFTPDGSSLVVGGTRGTLHDARTVVLARSLR